MAELATIARPYAQALFEASAAQPQATAAWLPALAQIAADSALQQVAANPDMQRGALLELIAGLLPAALPDTGRNFLRTVIDNGRLQALPEMARQFEALVNAASGAADAVVHSAFAMTPADLEGLRSKLETHFGKKLRLRAQVDESLIGGIRVVVGDEVLDASIKARVEQMKQTLAA